MIGPGTSGSPRTSRTFVIVVTLLWVVALAAAAFLIWFWQSGGFTPPTTTTLPPTTTTEAPTTTELPTTTEAPTTTTTLPPALTVSAGGDVMGDSKVGAYLDENGGAALFAGVKPYMEGAHLAFVNLEGAISDTGTRQATKEYTFRSRPTLLDGLVSAGIDVVSLANNHSLDYRWAALKDCIARLDAAGIKHAGAGASLDEAAAPAILDTPAGKVAVIAASQITSSFAASSSRAGTYYVSTGAARNAKLIAKVTEAASQADFVIVSLHWGVEYNKLANTQQVGLAHALIDAGADLILGHHPHVIQAMEVYKDRLIVYSLGDFVWDWHSAYTGEAFVLQVSLPRDGGAPYGTIVPVFLSRVSGAPEVTTGKTASRILDRLISISARRDLELTRTGDVIEFGTPPAEGVDVGASATTTTTSATSEATSTTTSSPVTSTTAVSP
jgi:poly-gamma-glutamate capsule biosynthesis protein CapA/YwtB (metallophosphatase superfamily)